MSLNDIQWKHDHIGALSTNPPVEFYSVISVYRTTFECPYCEKFNRFDFKSRAQYRIATVAKCNHCQRLVSLRGRTKYRNDK